MIDWTQISGVLEFRRLYKILVCSSLVMLSLTLFLFLSSPSADTAETSNEASSSQTKGGAFDGKGVLAVVLNGFRRTRGEEAEQLPLSQGDLSSYAQSSEGASPTPELFGHPVEEEGLEMVSHGQASQKQASHSEGPEHFGLPEEATFDASASEGSAVAGASETRTNSVFCQGAHDEATANQDWEQASEVSTAVPPIKHNCTESVNTGIETVAEKAESLSMAGEVLVFQRKEKFSSLTEDPLGANGPVKFIISVVLKKFLDESQCYYMAREFFYFFPFSKCINLVGENKKNIEEQNLKRGRSVNRDDVENSKAFKFQGSRIIYNVACEY
jgi:hypothetical protein